MKKLFLVFSLLSFSILGFSQATITTSPASITENGYALNFGVSTNPSGVHRDFVIQNATSGRTMTRIVPGGTNPAAFLEVLNSSDLSNHGKARLGIRSEYVIFNAINNGTPTTPVKNFAIELDAFGGETGEVFQVGTGGIFTDPSNAPTVLFHVQEDGKVGIGTENPAEKLSVNGMVFSEEVKVVNDIEAPDYVFKADYNLRSLEEVEAYIQENSHLPEIPSAAEFAEEGIHLGKMSFDLLKKVEELTLYMIELKKENETLKEKVEKLENK